MRRGDGAGADDHFAPGAHAVARAADEIIDDDGAGGFKQDAVGQRMGDDGEIGAPAREAPWRDASVGLYRNWIGAVARRKQALLPPSFARARWGG